MPLLELIVKTGVEAAIGNLPVGIRGSKEAVAETIANNVRRKITKEHLNDPAYYDRMSKLLAEIIADLRARRIDYAEYLQRIADLAMKVQKGLADDTPEVLKKSPGLRAIFNNLNPTGTRMSATSSRDAALAGYAGTGDARLSLALEIDETVKRTRPDDWRGHPACENEIKRALLPLLGNNEREVERVFVIIKQQAEY